MRDSLVEKSNKKKFVDRYLTVYGLKHFAFAAKQT